MRVLAEKELHELTRLYPAVAIDAARARMYKLDRTTQERINRIAIAAHGLLYKRRRTKVLPTLMRFFSTDYPRHFRRLWPYVVFSVAMFFVSGLGAYVTVQLRPSLIHVFIAEQLDMVDGEKGMSAEDMSERYRRMPHAPMAAGLMVNNISVAFNAFAFGITGGIGTCYVLLGNGTMLGAFIAHFTNHNQAYACWANLTPHGVLEIMAILISAAAGLRLGLSLAIPGRVTRLASLRAGAREAVLLVLGACFVFHLRPGDPHLGEMSAERDGKPDGIVTIRDEDLKTLGTKARELNWYYSAMYVRTQPLPGEEELNDWLVALDIIEPIIAIGFSNMALSDAFDRTQRFDIEYLPVVVSAEEDKFVGVLDCRAVHRSLSAEVLSRQRKADNIGRSAQ